MAARPLPCRARSCLNPEAHDPEARRVRSADAHHRARDGRRHRPRRPRRVLAARHRGVSEPGTPARRGHHSAERVELRGGRALRHDPGRDRARGDAGARPRALAVALRPERREVLLQVVSQLQRRAAGGHQPPPVRPAPGGKPGAALTLERHRRDLPLHALGQGLHAQGPQDGGGLDPRAAVQAGRRRHRRDELRRRDEGVPRQRGPLPPARSGA